MAMDLAQLNSITDIEALRALVAEQLDVIAQRDQKIVDHEQQLAQRDALLASRDRTLVHKDAKIAALSAEIVRLRRVQFAAKSEKLDPAQRALFEEAMAADIAAVEAELEALQAPAKDEARAGLRRRPSRRPLPDHLERVETRHEPASCTCGECGGALVLIGEHVSEKLSCRPLQFYVRRDVHPQYACRACETVTAVPVAPAVIDRGIAAPELLAQVLVAKYVDHLPLYRQEAIYARSGVELGRSTLAEWIGACGVALAPLVARMQGELRHSAVLHADETPVATLDPRAGKNGQGAGLHAAPLADAGPVRGRWHVPDRQQPDRERDPSGGAGTQELALRRLADRGQTRGGDHEPAGDGQGQRPRPACVADRRAHAPAHHARPGYRHAAAASLAARGLGEATPPSNVV